jgi:hypothetical protein
MLAPAQVLPEDIGGATGTPITIEVDILTPLAILHGPGGLAAEASSFARSIQRRIGNLLFAVRLLGVSAAIPSRSLLRRSDKGRALRSAPSFLLFLVCLTASCQTTHPPNPDMLKSFHDRTLNITYFYPSQYAPALPPSTMASAGTPKCIQPMLFFNAVSQVDTSSFAVSTIDNTCPEVLGRAVELATFTREQILRQLKQYGEPAILQEPTRYTIDDHPAVITVASVSMPAVSGKPFQTTYAAKACASGSVSVKTHKKSEPAEPVSRVLCFDFTTQNSGLLPLMFSFVIQFADAPIEPMFPGNVIRSSSLPTER